MDGALGERREGPLRGGVLACGRGLAGAEGDPVGNSWQWRCVGQSLRERELLQRPSSSRG